MGLVGPKLQFNTVCFRLRVPGSLPPPPPLGSVQLIKLRILFFLKCPHLTQHLPLCPNPLTTNGEESAKHLALHTTQGHRIWSINLHLNISIWLSNLVHQYIDGSGDEKKPFIQCFAFLGYHWPSTVLQTEILPYLAITDVPLRTPGK